jgi:hypothetical protein
MNLLEAVSYGKGTLSKKKIMPIANVGNPWQSEIYLLMSWASTSIGLASKAYLLQHISANIRGAEEKKGKKNTQVHVSWSLAKRLLSPQSSVFRGKKERKTRAENLIAE